MSENQKPLVSTRIPQGWLTKLQAIAEASGRNQSQLIQEAIGNYLGHTTPDSVKSLAQRVAALERKVNG